MKKIILSLIFILPISLFGQLDKLHQGMSLQDFHKNFSSAVPDLEAMTSSIYKHDTLLGVIGESQYIAVKDSVNQYQFRSDEFSGPSAEFPKADSADYLKLIRAAQELTGHYSDIFGTPTEQKINSSHNPSIEGKLQIVYSVSWKKPESTVQLFIHRVIENGNSINASVVDAKNKKNKSANYVMEINASGKGPKLRIDFEIGITKNQFRALMPALASQVKDFPDCWMMNDTLAKRDTEWHFWFVENGLAGFSYDCYAGDSYGATNKTVYPILIKKAKQLEAEEEKSYGRPTTLQAPTTDAYVPVKKVPNAFFYDDVYYNAEWEMDKGKNLFIRLHENGGKGETFLHLEVFFGEPKD